MTTSVRALLTCALLITPLTAAADPFDVAYGEGMAAWEAKDYAKARDGYERAYAIRPDSEALYAIAQTYRMEGNAKQAIAYYQRYLGASNTVADIRERAKEHIKQLEDRSLPKPPEPKPEPAAPPKKTEPEPEPEAKTELVRHRRIPTGSKIAAGVTGAALVSTTVFTVLGLRAESDLKTNLAATQKDADRVERLEDAINISLGIAAAAAVTTAVLYFATPSYRTERRTIAVAPIGDGWGAFVGGRF